MIKAIAHKPLMLGDAAPDFIADTTMGKLSFHQWIENSWVVFMAHPRNFTPVCTTELGVLAKRKSDFDKRGVKILTISLDSVESHKKWIKDINETQKTEVNFPMIGDESRQIAELYNMIDPTTSDNATARSVYFIDPNKKIRLILIYPQSTGRNFDEILRVIDSMQLTDSHAVSTPADWRWGHECVILPSITDKAVMNKKFPKGWTEIRPWLRITPQP